MTIRDKCPAYYCFSDLQPWDVIDAWGVDYYLGNVLKYICRAGRKEPDRLADLNKALHYLQKEVELAERSLAEPLPWWEKPGPFIMEDATEDATEDTTEDATEDTTPLPWEGKLGTLRVRKMPRKIPPKTSPLTGENREWPDSTCPF